MFKLIVLMLLGSLLHSVSAMDIEHQILKIRKASDSDRYKFVNELKRELSKLSRAERMHAIIALKHQVKSPSKNSVVALSDASSGINEQNGQHNILNSYQSVATADAAMVASAIPSKGAVGAEVLDSVNTAQIVSAQTTPNRPENSTVIPQSTVIQQAVVPASSVVNNIASTLPRAVIMRHNMRIVSYRI
ncbi:MAG: hypothetical protein U9P71_01810 [Campylobacterota bacterium]|nr:hypothetical protein [Campylobacterota bacterium]